MAKNLEGREIDEAFDGHAERPFDAMSPAEKLDYLWQRAVDLHWAESVRAQQSGPRDGADAAGADPKPSGGA